MKNTNFGRQPAQVAQLFTFCFIAAVSLFGQGTSQNNRILISPRPTTLMSGGSGCTVSKLEMTFRTGNDDLRGGGNDLNVEVHLADGSIQFAKNVNHGANWPNNSVNSAVIPLKQPVAPNEIRQIRLIHAAQGGYTPPTARQAGATAFPGAGPALAPIYAAQGIKSEDNWDMAEMQASAVGNSGRVPVASSGFHRFTGANPSLDVNATPNITCPTPDQVTELEFVFKTGNDDMRGGNDNLDLTILADSLTQNAANVNNSQRWADGSSHVVTVALNRPVTIAQIRKVLLQTTFGGGSGGDNWNMDSVQIFAIGHGTKQLIATQGFYRFTGAPGNRLWVMTK